MLARLYGWNYSYIYLLRYIWNSTMILTSTYNKVDKNLSFLSHFALINQIIISNFIKKDDLKYNTDVRTPLYCDLSSLDC
jgi:hypothetical protein